MTQTSIPAARQTKRYAQKQGAILDAAARHFNARGIRGTSLTEVAGSVGLMTNSITYYYRRKEDLAAACYLRTIAWHESLLAQVDTSGGPEARLRGFLRLYFRALAAVEAGDEAPQLRFNDIRALPSPLVGAVFEAYNALFRNARSLFLPTESCRTLTRDARNARAHLVLSVVHAVRVWIDRYETADYDRVGERVADLLLHGLAAPGSLWPAETRLHTGFEAEPTEPFLRAATTLINEEGYRGASVEKISTRLKVTKGSFYHHNDNKDDLVANCFARTFDLVRRTQDAAEAAGGSGWERLTACTRALVRLQLSEGGPLLRSTAVAALPDTLRPEIARTMRRLWERQTFTISDGIADGSVRAVDAALAAQVVSSLIDATSDLERWSGADADTAGELYVRPLFLGLASA